MIFPGGLTHINDNAFLGALAEGTVINLPPALTKIKNGAFSWSNNITYVFNSLTPPDV